MLDFLLASQNTPFAAALLLMLLIGGAQVAGLGDFDADYDVGDAASDGLLALLGLGRLPLLMWLALFLMIFGVIGYAGQQAARATAVAAEEQVATARETEIADRSKRIELIEAAKKAERDAIRVKVEAEAEKAAAANRAEAVRLEAEGAAEAEKLRAEAARVRFEVEAAGQRAVNEAANLLSSAQISLQTKLALLKVLPEVIREASKPLEAIDSIKIVKVDGLGQSGGASGSANMGGSGNLANDAVAAALSYRAQAPIIDGLMKELGLNGSSLDGLVAGVADDAPVARNGSADHPSR